MVASQLATNLKVDTCFRFLPILILTDTTSIISALIPIPVLISASQLRAHAPLSQSCNMGQLQCFSVQFKELKHYKFDCQDELKVQAGKLNLYRKVHHLQQNMTFKFEKPVAKWAIQNNNLAIYEYVAIPLATFDLQAHIQLPLTL